MITYDDYAQQSEQARDHDDDGDRLRPGPQRALNREERLRRDRTLRTGVYRGQEVPPEVLAEMRERHLVHLQAVARDPDAYSDLDDLVPVARFRYTGDLPRERGQGPWTWTVYECGSVTLTPCNPPTDRDFERYFAAGRHLDEDGNYRSLGEIARAFGIKPLRLARWLQFRDTGMCADIDIGGPGRPLRPPRPPRRPQKAA